MMAQRTWISLFVMGLLLGALATGAAAQAGSDEPGPEWGTLPRPRSGQPSAIRVSCETAVVRRGDLDLRFRLWDAAGGGSQVGSTVTLTDVEVSDGLFTAQLNFRTKRFDGAGRWLEVGVRCPSGSGGYTWMAPRQALTASPYALYALRAPWERTQWRAGGSERW